MSDNADLVERALEILSQPLQEEKPVKTKLINNKANYVDTPVPSVEDFLHLEPGFWIDFYSPLFGRVTARVQSVEVDHILITERSVLKGTDESCRIPASWILDIHLTEG